ncbi:MAG: 50S ribosomal protein L11 methyltransferase [Emcibacter sp.]|nr:50S ribosomal protein L11 methyltransferase [Emcibacter sp.]
MPSWKINLTIHQDIIPIVEEIMGTLDEDNPPTLCDFEIIEDDQIRLLEAYFITKPDIDLLKHHLLDVVPQIAEALTTLSLHEIEEKDWVSESQKFLQPVDSGLFFVYGSHDKDKIPENRINLLVEAGQAFGTGQHETTHGCLLAIGDLAEELVDTKTPKIVLDLGCGSGLLALAMSKIWPITIMASDIDPIATETTIENALANQIPLVDTDSGKAGIAAFTSDGFSDPKLSQAGPYDVIVANILAKPLQEMAGDIVAHLSEKGTLILSGLLDVQEDAVCQAYKKQGMTLVKRYIRGNWHSLLLRRQNVK